MPKTKPVLTEDLLRDAQLLRDIRGMEHVQVPLRLPVQLKDMLDEAGPSLLMDRMTLMRVAIARLLRDLGYAYPPKR